MQKQTLKFDNLMLLSTFTRKLSSGYIINTLNLTITSKFSEEDIRLGTEDFRAILIETSDKIFSYEPLA